MNELLKLTEAEIDGAAVQTVNARDLHAFLEVGKDFSTWIKDRIAAYDFAEGVDFLREGRSPELGSGNRGASTDYHLTLDMAKELAMVERNDKGKQARQYFIECERRLKEAPAVAAIDVRNPATLTTIAIQLIEVNKDLTQRVETAEKAVEAAKPKTAFYDKFADADGCYTLQNAGRILTGRPNKFISDLKAGYVFYQGGTLVPKVQYREKGVFEVKVTIIEDKARPQTFITPKGMQYFAKKFGRSDLYTDVA